MNISFFSQQPLIEWTAPLGSFFSVPWRLIVLSSLFLLLTQYLLPYLVLYYKKEQLYRLMPSPVTSPILGRILGHLELYWNAPAQLKNLSIIVGFHQFLTQVVGPLQEAGESLFLIRFGPFRKFVCVIQGKAVKSLLSSSKNLPKSPEYEFFNEFIGDCLVNGNGSKWKLRRKLLTPAFHLEILYTFLPAMNSHSRAFCSVIKSKMDAPTGKARLPDIRQLTSNCTLDILCETAMGVNLNCLTGGVTEGGSCSQGVAPTAGQQFVKIIITGLDLACERMITPWLYPDFIYRLSALGQKTAKLIAIGRQFTNSVIAERKVTLSKQIADCATVEQATARLTDGKRLSFLDLLLVSHLKDGESALPLSAIEDEVGGIMIGGMDTPVTQCAINCR